MADGIRPAEHRIGDPVQYATLPFVHGVISSVVGNGLYVITWEGGAPGDFYTNHESSLVFPVPERVDLRALLAQAEEALERAASTLVQPGTPTPQFCESVSADIRRALAAVREGRR